MIFPAILAGLALEFSSPNQHQDKSTKHNMAMQKRTVTKVSCVIRCYCDTPFRNTVLITAGCSELPQGTLSDWLGSLDLLRTGKIALAQEQEVG